MDREDKSGMLQSRGSERVGHNEQQQQNTYGGCQGAGKEGRYEKGVRRVKRSETAEKGTESFNAQLL